MRQHRAPNVPTAGFVAMATTEPSHLVVVSCMQEGHLEELKLLLHSLQEARTNQEALTYRITAGGQFLNRNPRILRELPIDFRAPTLRDFLEAVHQLYPVSNPSKKNQSDLLSNMADTAIIETWMQKAILTWLLLLNSA